MKSDWELKEEIMLSIAWDEPQVDIPFSVFSFTAVLSQLSTKEMVFNCKLVQTCIYVFDLYKNTTFLFSLFNLQKTHDKIPANLPCLRTQVFQI